MTTLFADNFESGDFSQWTAVYNSPTVINSPTYAGSKSAQIPIIWGGNGLVSKSIPGQTKLYGRCYVRFENYPADGYPIYFFEIAQQSSDWKNKVVAGVTLLGGHYYWSINHVSTTGEQTFVNEAAPSDPVTGRFYCVELYVDAAGVVTLWVDGVQKATQSGLANTPSPIYLNIGTTINTVTTTLYIDDVVASDSYIGPSGSIGLSSSITIRKILFSDGFETGNFSKWTSSSGDIAISSTQRYMGLYGAAASLDTYISSGVAKSIGQQNQLYTRAYFKITALPPAGYKAALMGIIGLGDYATHVGISNDNGVGYFYISDGHSQNRVDDTTPVTLNKWYCLELYFKAGGNAENALYINGVKTLQNGAFGYETCDTVFCGISCAWNLYSGGSSVFDDVVVADQYIGPAPFSDLASSITLRKSTSTSLSGNIDVAHIKDLSCSVTLRKPGSQALSASCTCRNRAAADLSGAVGVSRYVDQSVSCTCRNKSAANLSSSITLRKTLFSDDFETGDFSKWTASLSGGSSVSAIQSDVKYDSRYAAQISLLTAADGNYFSYYKVINAISRVYLRTYVRFSALPAPNRLFNFLEVTNISGQNLVSMALREEAGVHYWNLVSSSSSQGLSAVPSVEVNRWYCVELEYVKGPGGQVRGWVNGVQLFSATTDNSDDVEQLRIGNYPRGTWSSTAYDSYFDSVVAADQYIGPAPFVDLSSSVTIRKSASSAASSNVTVQKSSSQEIFSSVTLRKSSSVTLADSIILRKAAAVALTSSITLRKSAAIDVSCIVKIYKPWGDLAGSIYVRKRAKYVNISSRSNVTAVLSVQTH